MKRFFAVFLIVFCVFFSIFSVYGIYSFLFPIKFQEEVAAASEKFGVEQAVIFACINSESRFRSDAVSAKGAVGLMQLMPSTASWLSDEEAVDLTEPETNIFLGAKYLALLIDRFKNLQTALCAYNAGPTTVAGWLSDEECSEDGISLKKIPYSETEKYIEKFNRNLKFYRSKFG